MLFAYELCINQQTKLDFNSISVVLSQQCCAAFAEESVEWIVNLNKHLFFRAKKERI